MRRVLCIYGRRRPPVKDAMPATAPITSPFPARRQAATTAVLALCVLVLASLGGALPALVSPAVAARDVGRSTGLPVPRYVSLRADTVNLRTGPGLRYPIDWVFKRRGLPVRIVEEFNAWRKIETWDATTGWVHGVMLQGQRTGRVIGEQPRVLLSDPGSRGDPVAMVQPGAIGVLEACEGAYCYLDFDMHAGWLRRERLYGVDAEDRGR